MRSAMLVGMGWQRWSSLVCSLAVACGPVVGDDEESTATAETSETSETSSSSSAGDAPLDTTAEDATTDKPMIFDLPPPAPNSSGVYLFALSASIDPEHPLQWLANVEHDPSTGAVRIDMQSLSLDSGSTTFPREPVGDVIEVHAFLDEDGRFAVQLLDFFVPGAANPITGSDLTASLLIEGQAFGSALWCGEVSGEVTSPLELDLTGSTFAFEPVDGTALPDPVLARCPD